MGEESSRERRRRRLRLATLVAGAILLIPWTAYLGGTLPDRYVARNWSLTWIGFDTLLIVMFLVTAALAYLRRLVAVFAAFATAMLLVCDAWFDVTTADREHVWWSVASAILIELPIAAVLIRSSLRVVRAVLIRAVDSSEPVSLWRRSVPAAWSAPAGSTDLEQPETA